MLAKMLQFAILTEHGDFIAGVFYRTFVYNEDVSQFQSFVLSAISGELQKVLDSKVFSNENNTKIQNYINRIDSLPF